MVSVSTGSPASMSRCPYARDVGQLAVAGDGEEEPGEQAVVDVALEVAVEDGEPPGVEADVGGIDLALQGRHRPIVAARVASPDDTRAPGSMGCP